MKMFSRLLCSATIAVLCAGTPACAEPSPSPATELTKSLEAIKAKAQDVARERAPDAASLRDAARSIGVEWGKIEPSLARDFIVETRFANDSVSAFERDWRDDAKKIQSDAKELSQRIDDLLSVQTQGSPAPSATN